MMLPIVDEIRSFRDRSRNITKKKSKKSVNKMERKVS